MLPFQGSELLPAAPLFGGKGASLGRFLCPPANGRAPRMDSSGPLGARAGPTCGASSALPRAAVPPGSLCPDCQTRCGPPPEQIIYYLWCGRSRWQQGQGVWYFAQTRQFSGDNNKSIVSHERLENLKMGSCVGQTSWKIGKACRNSSQNAHVAPATHAVRINQRSWPATY